MGKTPINMKAVFKFDGDSDKISSITVTAGASQETSLLALGAESMRRDNSQVGVAASAIASTTNEAKLAIVDAYIKARMPNEGVQDVANTDVAGVLSTMDCPTCSIQIMYPRAEGPYVGKDAITKYLQTAPKATINVLGAPSASHEESDGSVVVTWKMQLEGGMAVGLAVQAMGIPWKTPISMKAIFKFDGNSDKISSITVVADSSQQASLLALSAEGMRRDTSQVSVAASVYVSATNEAKLAAVDAYIKARMPKEGV